MRRLGHRRALLGVVFVLTGCVTLPPNHKPPPQDPWESWNRGVYKFNFDALANAQLFFHLLDKLVGVRVG